MLSKVSEESLKENVPEEQDDEESEDCENMEIVDDMEGEIVGSAQNNCSDDDCSPER